MFGYHEIAGRIGSLLVALPLAIAGGLCSRFLWPEMASLVFYSVFLAWVLPWIGNLLVAAENDAGDKVSFSEARRRTRFWPNDYEDRWSRWVKYIFSAISSTLIEIAAAVLIAGLLNILLPGFRIYVFGAILAICLLGTIGMVVKDRRNATSGGSRGT